MSSKRLIKTDLLGATEGQNQRRRPRSEWLDDLIELIFTEQSSEVQKRERWAASVGAAMDTNGITDVWIPRTRNPLVNQRFY